ncbi:MAG: hypothetical protein K5849_04870, partial [Bacteroidales bacterium]|nr:hypothetical protein [Bacteroidales bacterium]
MKTMLLFLLVLSGPLGFQRAVLALSGASSLEDLSEDEIGRYRSLADHPVDLNRAGRGRLLATGLLSPFQVASLLEWRGRSGDILSWTELGLVDGFTAEMIPALQEFFVLGIRDVPPGKRDDARFHQTLQLKSGVRLSGEAAAGLKYEAAAGERCMLFVSVRNTYDVPRKAALSLSAAWFGRGVLEQVVIGAFNARFGQGLLQWSGFQLSGYNTLGAFRKNGTGLSPAHTYTPSMTGIAAEWKLGRWQLSTAYSWQDAKPVVNLTRTWRSLTAGLTATREAASLECRASLPGWSVFGEMACSWQGRITGIAGALWTPSYGYRLGLAGRWLGWGKSYSGVAAGYEGPSFSATLDAAWRPDTQVFRGKTLLQWKPEFVWHAVKFYPLLRLQTSWRPAERSPLRLDLRGAVSAEAAGWAFSARYDAVWGR